LGVRESLTNAIMVSLLVAAVVVAHGLYQTPRYEATAVMSVGIAEPRQHSGGPSSGQIHPLPNPGASGPGLQAIAQTTARAVPTAPVARAVVERLNLPKGSAGEVVENTSAEQVPGTTRINVTYEDSESKRAQLVANAIGQVVSQKISEVRLGPNRLTATVREPATLPQAPVSPKPLRNGLIALVASLAVALSVVLVASRYRSR
jgi:uncharacterized protein involved in exopolysaccharide biosynthesis